MYSIKQSLVIISAFSATLLLSSCSSKAQNEHSTTEISSGYVKIQSVEVVKPQQRSFTAEVLITGTALPNQKVILYAMESGYVQSIRKDIGDIVSKGEVIASLANPQLVRQLEEKTAQLKSKKSNYERLKSVRDKSPSLTPQQAVNDAEAEYLSIKAAVSGIEDRLSFLQIKAPFTGVITKRMVDNGALVQSGLTEDNPQGIVELQDMSLVRVTIPLPESDIATVGKGTEVLITFPELPGESFKASVSRTAGALDLASKTMQVEIDIDNQKGLVKPGMYAKVLLKTGSREGVVSLPITAQTMVQNQQFVLVVNNNKVERIPLRKGLSNKDYFEVLNPEITEESMVIVQGKGLVSPGQIVTPVIKSK